MSDSRTIKHPATHAVPCSGNAPTRTLALLRRAAQLFALAAALATVGCGDLTPPTTSSAVDSSTVDSSTSTSQPCTAGDSQVLDQDSGHCYMMFFATMATWDAARSRCSSIAPGAHLMSVTSPKEHDISVLVSELGDAWLGGSDLAQEGIWTWTTGEPMSVNRWGIGEPNDGAGAFPENCMVIRKSGGVELGDLWNDLPCDYALPYICELE